MAFHVVGGLAVLLVVGGSSIEPSDAWDVNEAYYRAEHPSAFNDERKWTRNLFKLTTRNEEKTQHRDIVKKNVQGLPRLFEDSNECGIADGQPPCCEELCHGLDKCSALNGRRIEDKYFPTLIDIQVDAE